MEMQKRAEGDAAGVSTADDGRCNVEDGNITARRQRQEAFK